MKFILSVIFILFSITSNGENITRTPNFTIKLNLSDSICNIKQNVYLFYITDAANGGTEYHLQDFCTIDKNSHTITLKGYVKEEREIYITFTEQGPLEVAILVEPNDHLEANIDIKDVFECKHMITASRHQAEYNQFIKDAANTNGEDKESFYANAIDKSDSPALANLAYKYCIKKSKDVRDRIFQKACKKFPNYQPFIDIKNAYKLPKESEVSKRFYKKYKEISLRRIFMMQKINDSSYLTSAIGY